MKTICRKCGWSGGRGRACCFAPWKPANLDLVTGKMTRVPLDCMDKNDGDCPRFQYRFVRRLWRSILIEVFTSENRSHRHS